MLSVHVEEFNQPRSSMRKELFDVWLRYESVCFLLQTLWILCYSETCLIRSPMAGEQEDVFHRGGTT